MVLCLWVAPIQPFSFLETRLLALREAVVTYRLGVEVEDRYLEAEEGLQSPEEEGVLMSLAEVVGEMVIFH